MNQHWKVSMTYNKMKKKSTVCIFGYTYLQSGKTIQLTVVNVKEGLQENFNLYFLLPILL